MATPIYENAIKAIVESETALSTQSIIDMFELRRNQSIVLRRKLKEAERQGRIKRVGKYNNGTGSFWIGISECYSEVDALSIVGASAATQSIIEQSSRPLDRGYLQSQITSVIKELLPFGIRD